MGVEETDQENNTLNVEHDKQELTAAVNMQSNDAGGAKKEGNKDENLSLEAVTDAISENDNTNTAKEELLLPCKNVRKGKNVSKGKNVVKKRKLVKKKAAVIKDEDKSKPSDMADASVEARTNEDAKIEENLAGKTMTDSVDKQNDLAGLASEAGDDIVDGIFTESEKPKDLEAANKQKEVVKRKLVKGKVGVAKDEEKLEEKMNDSALDEEKIVASADAQNNETGLTIGVGDNEGDKNEKGKEKIGDDGTKEKKFVKRKKVIKKRKVGKGKEGMKQQTTEMAKSKDNDKGEGSTKQNSANKVASMGMIFMCSSKTKEDCYRYKIMGLPANKKDAVLKVYKGMRLFLFDFQLKLLYGIYKAAGPGGYNIEPNAFNSNFPSQVRFTAVRDCSPLPEEKFRSIIKDNYYSKNKFNSELNSEQVKSLCKLFQLSNKSPKSKGKAVSERPKAAKRRGRNENDERGGRERDSKRRRVDAIRPARHADVSRRTRLEDDARRRARFEDDARRRSRYDDEARRAQLERMEDRRHSPLGLSSDRYARRADVMFEREAYLAPVADAVAPAPPYGALHGDYSRPARLLYDYETAYLPSHREAPPPPIVYRDPGYDVPAARSYYRDDHLASRYRLSPYRRY